jgi:hypothetical protein
VIDDLHKASSLPDLLVAALDRPDRPAVCLGDQILTGAHYRGVAGRQVN